MRHTEDFLKLVDVVARMRASRLPKDVAEGAVRAAWEEYKARSQDLRFLAAAERLSLFPPMEATLVDNHVGAERPAEASPPSPQKPARPGVVPPRPGARK